MGTFVPRSEPVGLGSVSMFPEVCAAKFSVDSRAPLAPPPSSPDPPTEARQYSAHAGEVGDREVALDEDVAAGRVDALGFLVEGRVGETSCLSRTTVRSAILGVPVSS